MTRGYTKTRKSGGANWLGPLTYATYITFVKTNGGGPRGVPRFVNGWGDVWLGSQILVYYSMGKTFKATVDWLGMVENGGSLPGQDEDPSVSGENQMKKGGQGMWANIHAKKKRGDTSTNSRPSAKAWKENTAQAGGEGWWDGVKNAVTTGVKTAGDIGTTVLGMTPPGMAYKGYNLGKDLYNSDGNTSEIINSALDDKQKQMGLLGNIAGPGDYADGANAMLSMGRGYFEDDETKKAAHYKNAAVSAESIINPVLGVGSTIDAASNGDTNFTDASGVTPVVANAIIDYNKPTNNNMASLRDGGWLPKAQAGLQEFCTNGPIINSGGKVFAQCRNRDYDSEHNFELGAAMSMGKLDDELTTSFRGTGGYEFNPSGGTGGFKGYLGANYGGRATTIGGVDGNDMEINPVAEGVLSGGYTGEMGGKSYNWQTPTQYEVGGYGKRDLIGNNGTTWGVYGRAGILNAKAGYNQNTGPELSLGLGLPLRQKGGEESERERFIQFLKDNEGGAEYIRNKNSVTKKIVDNEEWDGKSYHKIFDEDSQMHYAHTVGDEKDGTIGYGHHNKDVLKNFPKGITETKALEMLGKDADAALSDTEIWWNSKYKSGDWEKLDESTQYLLADIGYNVGHIRKFPKFAKAINTGDFDLAETEYKRYDNDVELGRNETYMEEYLKPWMDNQKEKIAVAPPVNEMPLPIGVHPIDGTLDTSDPFEELRYGGQHNWALDRRPTKAQKGKELKSDDIYTNDKYSTSATKYKGKLPEYQSEGAWNDFEKSKAGKFVNAKGLRQDGEHLMNTVGDYFGYDSDEGADLALDATAIINPAADFLHAGTKFNEGEYLDAGLYAGFGLLPFSAGPLVKGVKNKIINPIKNAFKSAPAPRGSTLNKYKQIKTSFDDLLDAPQKYSELSKFNANGLLNVPNIHTTTRHGKLPLRSGKLDISVTGEGTQDFMVQVNKIGDTDSGMQLLTRLDVPNAYYIDMSMTNQMDAGQTMKYLTEFMPKGSTISSKTSLSLDSYKLMLNRVKRGDFSVVDNISSRSYTPNQRMDLNMLSKDASKITTNTAGWMSKADARATIEKINKMLDDAGVKTLKGAAANRMTPHVRGESAAALNYKVTMPNLTLKMEFQRGGEK